MSAKLLRVLCGVVLVAAACAYSNKKDQYSVPEPTIQAFSPKGLRLSIPDSPKIKSVQFYLSFTKPIADNDPGTIAKHIDDKQGSHWIYYNQNVALKPNDMIHFKIIVKDERGLEWSRWGSYPIDKVVSLADNSIITADCDDEGQQTADFPDLSQLEASKSQVKSAYSMYKTDSIKPITRSTTSTTSGSYYVKPSGQVEASGFKSSSSYDSTRREGEQWQHSKSELSTADIEELKRLHGDDFMLLPAFAHLNTGNLATGQSSYHSSFSSTSGSHAIPSYGSSGIPRPGYGSSSYQQIGQTAETLPLIHQGPISSSSYSKYEKKVTSQAVPAISYGSSDVAYGQTTGSGSLITHGQEIEDTQSHIPVHIPSYSQSKVFDSESQVLQPVPSYEQNPSSYVQSKRYKTQTVTSSEPDQAYSSGPVLDSTYPQNPSTYVQSKHYKQETVTTSGSKPVITYPTAAAGNSKITETYEYTAPKPVTVTLPLSSQYYNGDVFRYPKRPTTPESCSATEYSYKTPSQIDVVALERNVKENQCLSVLAESIMKAEVRSLKEANTDLRTRLQVLEQQFSSFRSKCQCGY